MKYSLPFLRRVAIVYLVKFYNFKKRGSAGEKIVYWAAFLYRERKHVHNLTCARECGNGNIFMLAKSNNISALFQTVQIMIGIKMGLAIMTTIFINYLVRN